VLIYYPDNADGNAAMFNFDGSNTKQGQQRDAASRIGWSDSDERSPQGRVGLAAPVIARRIDGPYATTVFSGNSVHFILPRSVLDEDNEGPFIQADEIRAKVTLTPIPTSRESNLIRLGGIGPVEG
jgi:hypothetical protein